MTDTVIDPVIAEFNSIKILLYVISIDQEITLQTIAWNLDLNFRLLTFLKELHNKLINIYILQKIHQYIVNLTL